MMMVHYVMMIRTSSYITILILCFNDTLSLHGYFSLYDTGVNPEFSGRDGLVITLGNTETYIIREIQVHVFRKTAKLSN